MASFDSYGASSVHGHTINITCGTDTYKYYYIQDPVTARPFHEKEHSLVRRMYEIGRKLDIGQSESFEMTAERSYFLHRLGSHEFFLKPLL